MDIRHRSPDAEFILEGIEFDLPWRETKISPNTALKKGLAYRGITEPVDDFAEGFLRSDPKRFRVIKNWAKGELEEAIEESPILIIENDAGWYLVDGWHRTALAWAEGIPRITALIINGSRVDPEYFDH